MHQMRINEALTAATMFGGGVTDVGLADGLNGVSRPPEAVNTERSCFGPLALANSSWTVKLYVLGIQSFCSQY